MQSACKDEVWEEDGPPLNGEPTEYGLKYYYAEKLTWYDDGITYDGDIYSLIVTIDKETETVKMVNLAKW